METELTGIEPGTPEQVAHTIDVDAEALSLRNEADLRFQEGKPFAPTMYLFRKGVRLGRAICRPWGNDEDKKVALAEIGLLVPTFNADEIVFSYQTFFFESETAKEEQKDVSAVSVMAANRIGMTMRIFPFVIDDAGDFVSWTERHMDAANYDPFISSMMGGYITHQKKPYLLGTSVVTLNRRGHEIEVFPEATEQLKLLVGI